MGTLWYAHHATGVRAYKHMLIKNDSHMVEMPAKLKTDFGKAIEFFRDGIYKGDMKQFNGHCGTFRKEAEKEIYDELHLKMSAPAKQGFYKFVQGSRQAA